VFCKGLFVQNTYHFL